MGDNKIEENQINGKQKQGKIKIGENHNREN